jgi:hypothetical protein
LSQTVSVVRLAKLSASSGESPNARSDVAASLDAQHHQEHDEQDDPEKIH